MWAWGLAPLQALGPPARQAQWLQQQARALQQQAGRVRPVLVPVVPWQPRRQQLSELVFSPGYRQWKVFFLP
jgi:hypothetical protein